MLSQDGEAEGGACGSPSPPASTACLQHASSPACLQGFDDQIREMRKEGDIPSWAFSLMMWSRGAQLRVGAHLRLSRACVAALIWNLLPLGAGQRPTLPFPASPASCLFPPQAVEGARKRHTQLSARRDQFVAGLRGLERELRRDPEAEAGVRDVSADWMATAGYDWATLEQEEEATPEKLQTMLREALDKQTPGG